MAIIRNLRSLRVIRRFFNFFVILPLAILLVVLSVANRQMVVLALNPFRPDDQLLSVAAPFFVFLMLALMIGVLIGSAVTWVAQSRYRKAAKRAAPVWSPAPASKSAGRLPSA